MELFVLLVHCVCFILFYSEHPPSSTLDAFHALVACANIEAQDSRNNLKVYTWYLVVHTLEKGFSCYSNLSLRDIFTAASPSNLPRVREECQQIVTPPSSYFVSDELTPV